MNERIKLLAEQAGFVIMRDEYLFIEMMRKFGNLIVLDTIKDCRDMFVVGSVSWNLLNEKLEHFGVEEL